MRVTGFHFEILNSDLSLNNKNINARKAKASEYYPNLRESTHHFLTRLLFVIKVYDGQHVLYHYISYIFMESSLQQASKGAVIFLPLGLIHFLGLKPSASKCTLW